MMINKISDVQSITELRKSKPALKKDDVSRLDSASISTEGRQAAEFARNLQMVNDSPNIRMDKVRDIKEKINEGLYDFNNREILSKVAGEIAATLLKE